MSKAILNVFRGWGQLYARTFKLDESTVYPVNLAQCISYVAPKLHEMELSVDQQTALIHAFLLGVMDVFDAAINAELEDKG